MKSFWFPSMAMDAKPANEHGSPDLMKGDGAWLRGPWAREKKFGLRKGDAGRI